MKLLHTADWHLGNVFHGYRRIEEHQHFFEWLLEQITTHEPDVLLVTGDVFDMPNPSAEAEKIYYNFLSRAAKTLPGMNIIITAGNHDSASRLEAPQALLAESNIFVVGTTRTNEEREPQVDSLFLPLARRGEDTASCVLFALPYLRSSDYPAGLTPEAGLQLYLDRLKEMHARSGYRSLPIVVAAHFYALGAEVLAEGRSERLVVGGSDAVSTHIFDPKAISYVALGHIHRSQIVAQQPLTVYSGSALPMSFSEKHYQHGAQLVEIDPEGRPLMQRLTYEPLCALLTIPESGALSADEALRAISKLPKQRKDDTAIYPYLEVRIVEDAPHPELAHQLWEAAAEKAVRFCAIKRERSGREQQAEAPRLSLDQLRTISPLEMAEQLYLDRYQNPMPEALVLRFNEALSQLLEQAQE